MVSLYMTCQGKYISRSSWLKVIILSLIYNDPMSSLSYHPSTFLNPLKRLHSFHRIYSHRQVLLQYTFTWNLLFFLSLHATSFRFLVRLPESIVCVYVRIEVSSGIRDYGLFLPLGQGTGRLPTVIGRLPRLESSEQVVKSTSSFLYPLMKRLPSTRTRFLQSRPCWGKISTPVSQSLNKYQCTN